jgi:hypothetical protein
MQSHPMTSVADVTHYLQSWNSNIDDNIWGHLIELMEDTEQSNPYNPTTVSSKKGETRDNALMWLEQCGVNFPMMYVASIYLYLHAKSKGCDTFLFATRDCCHWVKIFKKLFPDAHAHYFHCSRNMFTNATEEHNKHFKKYVTSVINTSVEKTIYIDIHGTCQRVFSYFQEEFGQVPYCFLLSSSYRTYAQFPKICQKYYNAGKLLNIVFDARGTPIEMLNFDVIGTIQNYDENGPIRDPPEYTTSRLEPYHVCIKYMTNQIEPWESIIPKTLKKNLQLLDLNELHSLVRRIYRVIQDNKPILNNYIKHPGKH